MGRRSYAGGAVKTFLTSGIAENDILLLLGSTQGWPTGANGPFSAVIDRDQPSEEKVLISQVTAGSASVSIRGYDGPLPKSHSANATIEVCITAIDADEANAHINATAGIHGLGATERLVGETKAQTLSNKSISGASNTLTDIPREASPDIDGALDQLTAKDTAQDLAISNEVAARTNADTTLTTSINNEANARAAADTTLTNNLASEVTARGNADTAHVAAADPHPGYLTAAEADGLYGRVDSGWVTLATPAAATAAGFGVATGWTFYATNPIRYRRVANGAVVQVEIIGTVNRTGAALSQPPSGNVANQPGVVTIPALTTAGANPAVALRPTGTVGIQGPGSIYGRACSWLVNATGAIDLVAFGGTSDLGAEQLSFRGNYIQ